jgi:hypothetical protein
MQQWAQLEIVIALTWCVWGVWLCMKEHPGYRDNMIEGLN